MDQILERYKLPKLPQGEIDYLNSSISIKDIKLIVYIKNKQTIPPPPPPPKTFQKRNPGPNGHTGEFYQITHVT